MSGEITPEKGQSKSVGSGDGSAIAIADAKLLREILQLWDNLSNLKEGDPGYHSMTDHRHDTYCAGECLADKLEKIAKSALPNIPQSGTGEARSL